MLRFSARVRTTDAHARAPVVGMAGHLMPRAFVLHTILTDTARRAVRMANKRAHPCTCLSRVHQRRGVHVRLFRLGLDMYRVSRRGYAPGPTAYARMMGRVALRGECRATTTCLRKATPLVRIRHC
eukprot:3377048-Pleurochrysis_carterae.AAC.5